MLTEPGRLAAAREASRRLGRPGAAFAVAEHLVGMLEGKRGEVPGRGRTEVRGLAGAMG